METPARQAVTAAGRYVEEAAPNTITHPDADGMQATDLIEEIKRLPLAKRFYVVEETLKSIKKEEMRHQTALAAEALYEDYVNDEELTAFISPDLENFYEAK